jgi:thiamine monophosphate kinase
MFDINTISRRYFNIKINNIELEVEPPSKKALSKIVELTQNKSMDVIDGLFEAVEMILNKNRTGYIVPQNVIDELNMDQVNAILIEYFKWLTEVKNSPN